jgi:hypothetical protein
VSRPTGSLDTREQETPCPSSRSAQALPIPDRQHVSVTTYDAKDPATAFPPIEPLRSPEGAPNVLVILIDDAGFGSSSDLGEDVEDADHLITPEERLTIAMARP